MVTITFIEPSGAPTEFEARDGDSLMQAAIEAGMDAIAAECGGACACGTCHCYIEQPWSDMLPVPDDQEAAMLDCVVSQTPYSRLSCQVRLTPGLAGLVVRLPETQR